MTIPELEALWPLDTPILFTVRATHSDGHRLEWKYAGTVAGHFTDPEPGIVCRFANGNGLTRRPLADVERCGSTPADPADNGEAKPNG